MCLWVSKFRYPQMRVFSRTSRKRSVASLPMRSLAKALGVRSVHMSTWYTATLSPSLSPPPSTMLDRCRNQNNKDYFYRNRKMERSDVKTGWCQPPSWIMTECGVRFWFACEGTRFGTSLGSIFSLKNPVGFYHSLIEHCGMVCRKTRSLPTDSIRNHICQ